jgi:hypothetical protein
MSKRELATIETLGALANYVPEGWNEVCLDAAAAIRRKANKIAKLEAELMRVHGG